MTNPNDKRREYWIDPKDTPIEVRTDYGSQVITVPSGYVAMADVQPLVEAVGEFLKLNEAIKTDPHNVGDEWESSIERLEVALEKWNGK